MSEGEYPSVRELQDRDGRARYEKRADSECGGINTCVTDFGDDDGITGNLLEDRNVGNILRSGSRRVGLRRDRKKLLWQIGDMYANGASSRQIATHLGMTVSSVDRHLNLMHRQWAQEYETNLPSIRGQIDARLRSDEVTIRNQINRLLKTQAEESRRGSTSTFSHTVFQRYQKLLLEVLDRRMALYNVRGELQGEGGVHLHYTLYNFERLVDEKGLPTVIDVNSTPINDRGIVELGPVPETPGYENSDLNDGHINKESNDEQINSVSS